MNTWNEFFSHQETMLYFHKLRKFVEGEYLKHTVFPPKDLLFNAFKLTPYKKVKVVIIGQDPYFKENQAMGLAFSVNNGIKLPPTLNNIKKEISLEFKSDMTKNGDLTFLAKQGVLLINSILTVEEGKPLSHNIKEYSELLKNIILFLNSKSTPVVFMLWGNMSKKLKPYITNSSHFIIETVHPSPLSASRGWFNNGCFLKCNQFLSSKGLKEINWIDSE